MTLPARVTSYLVAGAVVALLLFWTFGKLDSYFGAQDQAITEASRQQLNLHPALARMRQKYLAVERRNVELARRLGAWTDSARSLVTALDSADSAARAAAGQPLALPSPWRAIADSERAGRAACMLGVLACSRGRESAEAEVDSLSRRLAAQLKVRDHPCGVSVGLGVAVAGRATAGATATVGCRVLRSPWP